MTLKEKIAVHQVYPLKFFTDWLVSFISIYFFWRHHLIKGLLVSFIPALAVSFLIINSVDLRLTKESPLGKRFLERSSWKIDLFRLFCFSLLIWGSWVHQPLLIFLGVLLAAGSWIYLTLLP